MGLIKKLFGKGSSKGQQVSQSSQSAEQVQGAMGKLHEAEDLLHKKQGLLERQIAQELDKARELNKKGNKKAALAALKKKKMLEAQLEQMENNLLRITEQQLALECGQTTILTLSMLEQASKAQAVVTGELSVEKVDALRDELEEQHDFMAQVTDLLGQPMGAAADIDEDLLAGELEDLELVVAEEEALSMATIPAIRPQALPTSLPSVPAGKPASQAKTAEELELESLEAMLAS